MSIIRLQFPCSIHPQGWVPIETSSALFPQTKIVRHVAFTPKGGCPLKLELVPLVRFDRLPVAFTPKGGCPLKPLRTRSASRGVCGGLCSIHPQGWVPIETAVVRIWMKMPSQVVAFTPKGGCPLKPVAPEMSEFLRQLAQVAFTPKGGCPLKVLIKCGVTNP